MAPQPECYPRIVQMLPAAPGTVALYARDLGDPADDPPGEPTWYTSPVVSWILLETASGFRYMDGMDLYHLHPQDDSSSGCSHGHLFLAFALAADLPAQQAYWTRQAAQAVEAKHREREVQHRLRAATRTVQPA